MNARYLAAAAAAALLSVQGATAASIVPTGYALGSSPGYADSTGAELTDGFVADRHYPSYYDPANGYGAPYVGWQNRDPLVSFAFAGSPAFGHLVVWVDDSHGAYGVTAPAGVSATVGGIEYARFVVGTPLDAGVDYSGAIGDRQAGGGTPYYLDLAGASGDRVELRVARGGEWTFVSEVQFSTDALPGAVPEPAAWAAMLLGLAGVGAALRRRGRAVVPA